MSFTTPNGTRGAKQPRASRVIRWMNAMTMKGVRRNRGKVMGMNALIVTTVGKQSGLERQTPLGYFPAEREGWIVVAAAAGAPRNPAWYYNMAARPDKVVVEVGGKSVAVTAHELHGDEREMEWSRIITAAPRFAQYAKSTDRVLPVIWLEPRALG